jgi:hypothetical protein
MKAHFQESHKSAPISKYEHLWKLSNFETTEMKKLWERRRNVVMKRTKKSKVPPLLVSENHRAHIPVRYLCCTIVLTGRKICLPLFCCSHSKSLSPSLDSASLSDEECDLEEAPSTVPGDRDAESISQCLEEGSTNLNEKEDVQGVFELPMSVDVDMIEFPAVANQESMMNVKEPEKNDSVSSGPCYVKSNGN